MAFIDLTRDDHAYFFGFFQTDGHLSAQSRNRGKATIEVGSVDAPILHAFSALFPELTSFITERTRSTNFAAVHTATTWRVHTRAFRDELVELGIPVGRKSDIVTPPAASFDERGYLRGLVDGDGSVGFTATGRPFLSFVSASAALSLRPGARSHGCPPNGQTECTGRRLCTDDRERSGGGYGRLALPRSARQINRTDSAVNMRRWRLRQGADPAGRAGCREGSP